jgi:hypothetical protein
VHRGGFFNPGLFLRGVRLPACQLFKPYSGKRAIARLDLDSDSRTAALGGRGEGGAASHERIQHRVPDEAEQADASAGQLQGEGRGMTRTLLSHTARPKNRAEAQRGDIPFDLIAKRHRPY